VCGSESGDAAKADRIASVLTRKMARFAKTMTVFA